MKKLGFVFILILVSFLNANIFQSVEENEGILVSNEKGKEYCSNCGNPLLKYYKTNHVHKNHQYCSLHCLYASFGNKIPDNVQVVDTKTLKFIDAKKAYYVLSSKVEGTMTDNSKYAFESEEDAKEFIEKNGGDIVDFEIAYAIAMGDYEKDSIAIRKKKEKKIYKMGKKLFETKCKKVDLSGYHFINVLKDSLKENCNTDKEKELQLIATYLWDIEKLDKSMKEIVSIAVPEDARCPICGMFVKDHPKWACVIEDKNKSIYFDGVKDMMKYIISSNKDFEKIYVTDYFTTKKVDARRAFYVIGSDVYGPMGKDLIAFESDEAAYNFKNDHFGKKVMLFSQLTDEVLIYLK